MKSLFRKTEQIINRSDPNTSIPLLEKFTSPKKVDMRKVNRIVSEKPVFNTSILDNLTPLSNLNNSHPAKEYILNRKLPTSALYYTEKFQEWTNSVYRGTPADDPKGFQPEAIGNYKAKSDVADLDNIYLSDQGWVYRHFKPRADDAEAYWDEIIWAGDVSGPGPANDATPTLVPATPEANDPVGIFGAESQTFQSRK